jgi:hypothetical protein
VTKSKDNKRRKAELLGMPVGTAERQLRKAVIHELAKQCGRNICRWCRLEIEEPNELAITHVEDWEESPDLYFDLGNVALSHASCAADRGGRRQGEMSEMKIEVSVEDAQNNRLPGTRHNGELYVAGNQGKPYQVRVRNRTGKRILVVTTVDGRNVQTGEPGSYEGGGHVLEPHQSWVYKGWRTSDDAIAAFRFGSKRDSYSSQLGSGENVGVIGVAVFEEKMPDPKIITVRETRYVPLPYIVERPAPWYPPTWTAPRDWIVVESHNPQTSQVTWTSGDALAHTSGGTTLTVSSAGLSSSSSSTFSTSVQVEPSSARGNQRGSGKSPARQELGTEFGEQLHSSVQHTSFNRATEEPCEVHAIRYDSADALRRQGIRVDRPSQRHQQGPSPFPENQDGYCKPPPRHAHKR